MVGLLECDWFHAIWVVANWLLKIQHFIACHTMIDAPGLAELSLKEVVHLDGPPLTIVLDRGPQFASMFWGQICSRLGNDRRMSTAFHPQTDGQMEWMNASTEQNLRVLVDQHQDDWLK